MAEATDATLLDSRRFVETPEGIFLQLAPAGVVARLHAFAIDFAIRLAVFFVVALAAAPFGGLGYGISLVVFFALEWLYPVVFEMTPKGATPGKRALSLRVVMDSGLPVTPAASLTRNLLRGADFLPFAYATALVCMLVRDDFKRLGDMAAGTLVVHVPRRRHAAELPEATPRPPWRPLAGRSQRAIVAWAERVPFLTDARAAELAALALPASAVAVGRDGVTTLLGVARWLVGRR